MEKIDVKICTGTMCHIMGGSDLRLLKEYLPKKALKRVNINGITCLNFCKKEDNGLPPFALIAGQMVSSATIPKVVEIITKLLEV